MSVEEGRTLGRDDWGPANPTWAIFLVSVLGLFLEMLLIRWISTEIRIFAYLQNTVLVVCFLGLGLGCFTSRQPIVMRKLLIPLLFLVTIMAIPITRQEVGNISEMLSGIGDYVIWYQAASTSLGKIVVGSLLTLLLMVLLLEMFIPLGRLLGRLLDEHPRIIWAYSVNIGGSFVGTWLFVLLSILYQPPVIWFGVMACLLLYFIVKSRRWKLDTALLIAIVIISWATYEPALKILWSPYQKLVVTKTKDGANKQILVNNVGYQVMLDLKNPPVQTRPDRFPPEMLGLSQYDIPLLVHPHPQSILIVGAGSGNDAAGALRNGVRRITAVEIDPAIIALGRRYHPEKPYDSPSVNLVNDDARSFFATSKDRYDVISFGLLDSHTTTAMTNARLDHYVYTQESIVRAKSLLAPGGIMVLSFEAQKEFIADRMAGVLREVFGGEPICFRIPDTGYGWGGVLFITGDLEAAKSQIAQNERLSAFIQACQAKEPVPLTYTTKITTDDWPYIYLRSPGIPLLYFMLAGLMVLLVIRCRSYLNLGQLIRAWDRSHWHFFFLGAAFLLLEVQNISKAAVVLGNTWDVNAVIISGVLTMILLANLVAARFPHLPLKATYIALVATCLLLYFVDLSRFAFLPYATKAVIIGALTTLPMLFSGIVFIRSFAVVAGRDVALGANLIGALVGALLQSVTFVTGIKALLLMVAGLYLLSMLTRPKVLELEQAPAREPVPTVP
ncbi:MAG: hypothetical protein WBV23_00880 [Desulfobaccales bacterium]